MNKEEYKYSLTHSFKRSTGKFENEDYFFSVRGDDMDDVIAQMAEFQQKYPMVPGNAQKTVTSDSDAPNSIPDKLPEPALMNCPDCGKPMKRRQGKYGEFFGCTGYPGCKKIINIK